MRSTTSICVAAALVSGIVTFACRPVAAAPAHKRNFVLTSFVQRGRTDLYRNELLEFRFSAPLRSQSVTGRSLRVMQTSPVALEAEGALIVADNVIRFDPRRTQRNYDESVLPGAIEVEMNSPEGLPASAEFVVSARSSAHGPTLKSRDGRRLARSFTLTCGTGTSFLDPVPGQPSFIGDHGTGLLGFDPPRSGATGLIDADASIVLEFSEPILSTSLVPGTTVFVTRRGSGTQVTGTIVPEPGTTSGRRFLFRPTGGFGSDAGDLGWDIDVVLTTGITDLAGNPLKRGFGAAVFRTRPDGG